MLMWMSAVCAADDKITELLDSLEMQKDESIERTFKGVAKHFREVFAELVPGGKGELVMIKRRQVRTSSSSAFAGNAQVAGAYWQH